MKRTEIYLHSVTETLVLPSDGLGGPAARRSFSASTLGCYSMAYAISATSPLLFSRVIPATLQSPHRSIINVHGKAVSSRIPALISRNSHVSNDNAVLHKSTSLRVKRFLAARFQYSSSSHPSTSQPLPIAFDDFVIAKGEDEGLMRQAFALVNTAASPSGCGFWSITEDRKGLERKFTFQTFNICWVGGKSCKMN